MIEVTRYQCSHCKKKEYKSKAAAKVHEKICYSNPEHRACASCKYHTYESYVNGCENNNINTPIEYRQFEFKLRHNCPMWAQKEE